MCLNKTVLTVCCSILVFGNWIAWSSCPYGPPWYECQWEGSQSELGSPASAAPCYLNPPDGPIIVRSDTGPQGQSCWCYSQVDTVSPIDMISGQAQWFLTVNGVLVEAGRGTTMSFFVDWRTNCTCEDEFVFVVTCPPNVAVMQHHRLYDCGGCTL